MASVVSSARGRGRSRGRRRPRGLLARHRRMVAAHKRTKANLLRHWETPDTLTGWLLSRGARVSYRGGRALYRLGGRASRAAGNSASRRIEAAIDKRTTWIADGQTFKTAAEFDAHQRRTLLAPVRSHRPVDQRRPLLPGHAYHSADCACGCGGVYQAWNGRVDTNAQPPDNYGKAVMSNKTTQQFVAAAEAMVLDLQNSTTYTDFHQKLVELHAMTARLDEVVSMSFANVAPAVQLDARVTKHVTEGAASGQLSSGLENAKKAFAVVYKAQLEAEQSSNVKPLNLPAANGRKAS